MHSKFMLQAIQTGEKGRFLAPPNPWVGCLIVKNDQIISSGFTQSPGDAHAEICAINQAQDLANATMYVSLEPCAHHGRTPPCVDAIIKKGISTVFIAQQDPDSLVQGKGIAALKAAGIHVSVGLCEEEARRALAPYLHHRKTGKPFTILKAATSLDGRIAAEDGSSQWISPPEARQDAHLMRAGSQAIIIGSGTVLKDKPALTVRHEKIFLERQPLRVILDSRGRVLPEGSLFDTQLAPTLLITTEQAPSSIRKAWDNAKIEVAVIPSLNGYIDLNKAWEFLGSKGVLQALVEGGPTLHSSLLKTNLVNRIVAYLSSLLLGSTGHPFFLDAVPTLDKSIKLSLLEVNRIGNCIKLEYACDTV